ncbi:hypothetical protein K493DRAFT_306051 [Basidiobolus meristosporus CBS 931.73]|uniref:Uncharacterized protein n=1 Tax=Basidiobolus meristosporus CBS 931.73 TaxID=1314790 RepID=A0A1Y1XTK6_9FUNG|nr:hypothetical protein K493DRAFT_306051 [Basidiobolus meristosporus CBS 931.73]|eukprot:ORX89091.1 hypothetical protein K493DRAFT_306051 [Basidiobolus meristosporus CBS 931.73]
MRLAGLITLASWLVGSGVTGQIPSSCPARAPTNRFLKKAGCPWIRQGDNGTIGSCCEEKDSCYSNCNKKKNECDEEFRGCMLDLCINEFVPANPEWGDTTKCLDYWNQLDAAGARRWRLHRAEDFSCQAYERARKSGRCTT